METTKTERNIAAIREMTDDEGRLDALKNICAAVADAARSAKEKVERDEAVDMSEIITGVSDLIVMARVMGAEDDKMIAHEAHDMRVYLEGMTRVEKIMDRIRKAIFEDED